MTLTHTANPGRHRLAERKDDSYPTPPEAVLALLEVESLPRCLWEPCCGRGNIVSVLRDAGHRVYATDLVNCGCPDSESRIDFLFERKLPDPSIGAIVTNPPFKLAEQFIAHALELVPLVAMLLRLAFLESEQRTAILEQSGLARIHVFRKRLPMMHRAGWTGKRASSAIPFAWFVWQRGFTGRSTWDRI
jgi:hypothetical protein